MALNLPRQSTFDLFPKSRDPFSVSLFRSPTSEYLGCPFWAWNTELHRPELRKEIGKLQDMGFGGFTIHVRVGLDTPYLGEDFMQCVAMSVAEAKKKGMKVFLYDEDRWPSGAAGGLVTRDDPSVRMRHLLFTPWKYGTQGHGPNRGVSAGGEPFRSEHLGDGQMIGRFAIKLDENGFMTYRRMQNEPAGRRSDVLHPSEKVWYAYIETNPQSSWFNDSYYADTLSEKAIAKFLDKTHEKYYAVPGIGDEFGKTITAIFTDEPQHAIKNQLEHADDEKDLFMPWTDDLQKSFMDSTGIDLLARLPELFWDLSPDRKDSEEEPISTVKYKFHDHVTELFASNFMDQIASWCNSHSIGLMGHLMEEPTLIQQCQAVGECMRNYRSMQIPGIDMLTDSREYNTAKQCSSVARQYARTGCLSEIYGVTNWTFSFKGYKGQGDWQAALGVTLRTHHLSWVTMSGECKRDYPAQIGYQSPWYKEYDFIESHFARVAMCMSRGVSRTKVAVIHPIESFWMKYGCRQTARDQEDRDRWFAELTEWLLFGLIDFDFISESLLPELVTDIELPLKVGAQSYDCIVLPHLLTVRSTTLNVLEAYSGKGGRILVAGGDPILVDGRPSHRFAKLEATRINFEKVPLLRELDAWRDIDIVTTARQRTSDLLYQWRDDGEECYVFIANTDRDTTFETTVTIKGQWRVTVLDTLSGKTMKIKVSYDASVGSTSFDWIFDGCESLMLNLLRRAEAVYDKPTDLVIEVPKRLVWQSLRKLKHPEKSKMSERNCLLLDYCVYRIDNNQSWSELDEVLRIDNAIRDELEMYRRGAAMAQPWVIPKPRPKPEHKVHLRYSFQTSITLKDAELALEGAHITKIYLDGQHIPSGEAHTGQWWVDLSISCVALPLIIQGRHEIDLEIEFDALNTCLERVYLLGDFSVSVDSSRSKGTMAHISSPALKLIDFGDYTQQGLPFYTGNISYFFTYVGTGALTALRIPSLGVNPLVAISIDGRRVGRIALPPYELVLGLLEKERRYEIELEVFGNRDHAFGAVHVPDGVLGSYGPGAWRTEGWAWNDGYTIRAMGLLEGLEILVC